MIHVQIVGLDDNLDKMTVDNLLTGPMREFFWDAGQDAVKVAKGNAPVWTGELRESYGLGLDKKNAPPKFVIIGPRRAEPTGHLFWKASVAEYGSGVFATLGHRRHGRHTPPDSEMLESWALSHGFESGYAVARAIGRRGGIRPKRPLHRAVLALKSGQLKIRAAQLERAIAAEWEKP